MRFACQTLTWQKDVLGAIRQCHDIGFEALEGSGFEPWYESPHVIGRALEEAGMQLVAVYYGAHYIDSADFDREEHDVRRALRFMNETGAELLVLGGGRLKDGGNPAEDYEVLAKRLDGFGQLALEHGARAAYHPHAGTMVQYPSQIHTICGLTCPETLGMAFDTAHIAIGGDPLEVFQDHLGRVVHVHFKDLDEQERFVELGCGTVDLPAVYQLLHEHAYQGWVVAELDRVADGGVPADSAQRNFEYLTALAGMSGPSE